jgi:hypothetical protein
MTKNYYQVLLKTGKVHPSLYINPQTAIRKVGGLENVKEIRAIRAELVEAQYNEVTGKINIE